jgi:hypothetical protein
MTDLEQFPELLPTPLGPRLTQAQLWDDADRPARTVPSTGAEYTYTTRGRAAARSLKMIHDHLRRELETIRDLVEQVASGDLGMHEAQLGLGQMSMRQNNWALGAYCASYCRLVAAHHGGEDSEIFPNLRWREPALAPVLDRLAHEHVLIHELLDAVDAGLVALVSDDSAVEQMRDTVGTLSDALLSHLAYEELQLLEAFARYFG